MNDFDHGGGDTGYFMRMKATRKVRTFWSIRVRTFMTVAFESRSLISRVHRDLDFGSVRFQSILFIEGICLKLLFLLVLRSWPTPV